MSQQALILAAGGAVAVAFLLRNQATQQDAAYAVPDWIASPDNAYLDNLADTMPDQAPGTLETLTIQAASVGESIASAAGFGPVDSGANAQRNERAFLDMIAYSEGTSGPNGYRTMFGGSLAQDLADHPRKRFTFTDKTGKSNVTTAAGRYQFLARTWDALRAQLDLPDFGPASQDSAAIELIRQRGALRDVDAGRIAQAIAKCAPIWASLPGAGYNQPERKLSSLLSSFAQSGGITESQA